MEEVKLILDCKNILGEGILWNDQESLLYWTDIEGRIMYQYNPASRSVDRFPMGEKLCSFAFRKDGGFLLAFESGLALSSSVGSSPAWIWKTRKTGDNVRLNDGRCDRAGRFIVGEFDPEEKGRGQAYRYDPDGKKELLFGGLNSANSTCFSPDGKTMYYSCAVAGEIWAFDYDQKSGLPSNKRLFHSFSDQPGLPDGSVIDSEGYLWNAQWAGSRIVRIAPDGRLDRVIELPVKNITCLCFGGDDLDTLYITTARMTLSEKELNEKPLSGGLFALRPGVTGIKESRFKG